MKETGQERVTPDNWFPSTWGPDDEIGAANYLTPEKVLSAARLITTGKTYSLGMETNSKTPAYEHRSFKLYVVQPGQQGGKSAGSNKFTYNDEIMEGWTGVGTQINGLSHYGVDHVYYNGNKAADFVAITGVKKLGIEKIPPIVTRGVLLDMTTHFGTDVVKEGTAFNKAEIEAVAMKQGVEISRGDVVIFHTGWLSLVGKDNKRFLDVEPGIGREGARYLVDKGVVAIGADTWGLEVKPFESKTAIHEVNQFLGAKSGVYVLENLTTAPLAKGKVYEFLFVLGQPRFTGTTQAIINPVAIR